jgi:hypothetical protein
VGATLGGMPFNSLAGASLPGALGGCPHTLSPPIRTIDIKKQVLMAEENCIPAIKLA